MSIRKVQYTGDYLQDILIAKNVLLERTTNDYIDCMVDDSIRLIRANNTLNLNEKVVEGFINKVRNVVNDMRAAVLKAQQKLQNGPK